MTVGAREKRSTGVVNHWAESMRLRLEESLRPLLPPGGPVALLDFPVYPNVGDSAIWLGAVATLRDRKSVV